MNRFFLIYLLLLSSTCFAQPNYSITDPSRYFKEAKDHFIREQFTLAYPLLKELKQQYPQNTQSSHLYINQDVEYYYIVCGLKLEQGVAEAEAKSFIEVANNEPRQQIMGFHLARYYFAKKEYGDAVTYYERAGYDNLSNGEIADAKFELAYAYFNLRQLDKAKPLFNEIHQLPGNKYYYAANYYYGFISYRDRDFSAALTSFKAVEEQPEYAGLVPYYIAEIYYFQGKKDEALRYGEEALKKENLYYKKDLNLLIGQIAFEKRQFAKALPLLEEYVNSSDKVGKDVMYELSYCYYELNQVDNAIKGFKQLSNEKDSLGQNSMYLLGDLYLRTNQKVNARNAFQYSANNSSNRRQQEISRFNYAKLSYDLGYQDVALTHMKTFLDLYPNSAYATEAKEILISILANTNNFNEALGVYESFDKPTPAMQKVYPKILFGQATALINEQQIIRAGDILNIVIKDANAGKVLPYAYFWKGEIASLQTRYDEAIGYMNNYLQTGGPLGEATPAAANYIIGYSFLKKEDYSQALRYFDLVTRNLTPQSSQLQQEAYLRTADSYFMLRDYNKAKSLYNTVIANALPESDYALYQTALIAGISSSSEKIKILNTLGRQYPSSSLIADANMEIANTFMAAEKFRDAISYLNNIVTLPNSSGLQAAAYLKLGLSWYNMNDNSQALGSYQKLISTYPQSAEAEEALENMKSIYVEEGKPDEYLDVLKKAGKSISVSDADSLSWSAARMKYTNGDCVNAIAGFNNYLNRYADGNFAMEAYFLRSECYVKSKDFKNALTGYEAVTTAGNNKYAERAALAASRIYYFELQDYDKAKIYFLRLKELASTPENTLEALRGLVRTYYQTRDYTPANKAANDLLMLKGLSADDKAIANLVLAKSLQAAGQCNDAIPAYKAVTAVNKAAWGAEARYEIAGCYFTLNDLASAEKAALEVIKITGAYDYWVAKAYLLLGDVYMQQKDFFNAKATYQSVADNTTLTDLKAEAREKLEKALEEEKVQSKIGE